MEKHVIDFSVAYQLPAKVNSFATLSPRRDDTVFTSVEEVTLRKAGLQKFYIYGGAATNAHSL